MAHLPRRHVCRTPQGRARAATDRILPLRPAFFGRSGSANNTLYRTFGLKQRRNEEVRAGYRARARLLVEEQLQLELPETAEAA
jgi:ring-1,2-phenylacetyl-CoA epoxidase subunit PaaA